jgi:hypothetical protein
MVQVSHYPQFSARTGPISQEKNLTARGAYAPPPARQTFRLDSPVASIIGQTSRVLAEYRNQKNTATWALGNSTVWDANPESRGKLMPSLWSQNRGLVPNVLIIPTLNMDNRSGAWFGSNRANLQVGR